MTFKVNIKIKIAPRDWFQQCFHNSDIHLKKKKFSQIYYQLKSINFIPTAYTYFFSRTLPRINKIGSILFRFKKQTFFEVQKAEKKIWNWMYWYKAIRPKD